MSTHILLHFGITFADLLGQGGESAVYALDVNRVLRIYPADASPAYIEARRSFYALLAAQNPSFAFPQVLDHGVIEKQSYTIEQRMHGHDFAHVLPQLTGQNRERALISYLDLAAQIGTVAFPNAPFGELILPEGAIQRDTWTQYLWDRTEQTLRNSRPDILSDVPHLDRLLSEFHTQLQCLEPMNAKCLVHGDYFPGNVFIDNMLTVYGVGDFGYSTVVGDPRMDVVGAVVFMEVVDGYQATDTQILLNHLQARSYHMSAEILALYRLYYSFYFSYCKDSDPPTYAWCVQNLLRHELQ